MECALASNAATQGVGILAHYQNGFTWEGVAASGVGAYTPRSISVASIVRGARSTISSEWHTSSTARRSSRARG